MPPAKSCLTRRLTACAPPRELLDRLAAVDYAGRRALRRDRIRLQLAGRTATASATKGSRDPAFPREWFATVPIVAPTPAALSSADHRNVCSPQPAAADRRPRIRRVAPPRTGAAACRRGFGNADRKRPHYFRERGEVLAGRSRLRLLGEQAVADHELQGAFRATAP